MVTQRADAESKDEKEIRALGDRVSAAIKAKNVDAIMANCVPDESLFIFNVNPPLELVGAKAYRKHWEDFLATIPGPIVKSEFSDLSIMTDGKLGLSHGIVHLVWNDRDGKKLDITYRLTTGYRKIEGKWLIVHVHVSVPVDITSGMAVFSSKP